MMLLFQVCFGVGVGYTLISFLLGEILDIGDFDGEIDFGSSISPFKPACVAAFITVFGAAGMILSPGMGMWFAAMVGGVAGLLVAYLMYRFIIIPLHKAQNTSAVEKQSLIGHNAMVTEKIPQGKFGKITYYVNGNTYSSPAKSEDGEEILRNTDVEIVHIDRNTYYVKRKRQGFEN